MSTVTHSTQQAIAGVANCVAGAAIAVTDTVNLLGIAARAGNVKANAWLNEVTVSTNLESRYASARIHDEVTNKVALRIIERKKAMQDQSYASAYEEAQKVLGIHSSQQQPEVQAA